jgi:hypothetical protein
MRQFSAAVLLPSLPSPPVCTIVRSDGCDPCGSRELLASTLQTVVRYQNIAAIMAPQQPEAQAQNQQAVSKDKMAKYFERLRTRGLTAETDYFCCSA